MGGEGAQKWARRPLSAVVSLQRGYDLPTYTRRHGNVPVIGSAGLSGYHDTVRAPGPGVVVGRSGASFGKVHWCGEAFWPLNTGLFVLDFHGNDPRFAFVALKCTDFTGFNSGSAQPSLNRNLIAQVSLNVPPLREQRAITSVLGAFDDKIDSNWRLVSRQREVREAQYRHVVRDADRRQALHEIATIVTGTVQPSVTPDAMFEQFSIPAFDAGEDPNICAGATMASGKTALPAERVVLLSKLNPRTPRVWNPVASGRGVPVCSPEFVVLAPAEAASHAWLEACVRSDSRFYDEVLSTVAGTTGSRQRVKPADLLRATVPVMSSEALEAWTSFAAPLIARETTLDRERRTLTALRDALLPKLVSGQIRVPLTRDEQEAVETVADELETGSAPGY